MLSYRHGFHAGNPADVLKHLVLVQCLEYLNRKDKPYCVIDTHAGAGRYRLDDPSARKTGEHLEGIGRLWNQTDAPAPMADYFRLLRELNSGPELRLYPGSPWLIRALLRPHDRASFFELHSQDYQLLERHLGKARGIQVHREDGFAGCLAMLPPRERRGLILMDPSYEVKEDYRKVLRTLERAYRRFATGTYLLWYPVVDRERVNTLERDLKRSALRNIQLFELATRPDSAGHGMTASGMVVINPPWTLESEMRTILPWLAGVISPDSGDYRIRTLAEE